MLRVTHVEVLDDSHLRLQFSDGVIREIDCGFLMRGTLGEPLRDPSYFRRVRVDEDSRTIMWPNGLDPSPELLHDHQQSSVTSRCRIEPCSTIPHESGGMAPGAVAG